MSNITPTKFFAWLDLWGRIFFLILCFIFISTASHNLHAQDTLNKESTYPVADSTYLLKPLFITGELNHSDSITGKKESNFKNPQINWTGFTLTSAALAGFYTGLFSYEQKRRWDAPAEPFYFNSEFGGRGIDKAGHFYATKAQASLISNLFTLSNVSEQTSNLLGAGVALSVQTLVEIKDGIYGGGFDVYDEAANLLGASWFYTREQSKFLQRFHIRWFYYPSPDRELLPPEPRITGDYNGHTYWLSMRMWDLLPSSWESFWPKFIVPAAGISLNDWSVGTGQEGYYSYHLSLNPDFEHILPQQTKLGRTLGDFFNSFYVPAPAVEVYPNFGFKLIFYGQK